MPAFVQRRNDKFRVVHKVGSKVRLVKRGKKAVDGGGHSSKAAAARQARAINR